VASTSSPETERFLRPDIAFFVRAMEGGGAQRDAILLANAIAASGRAVALITLRPDGHLRELVAPGVPVIKAPGHNLRSAIPGLRRVLRDLGPRVLVSAEAAPNTVALLATRLLPRAGRPKLVLREAASPSLARDADPYPQNRLAYRILRWTYPRADTILTLTAGARTDLIENFAIPAAKVAVLPSNAVVDPALLDHPEEDREPGLIVSLGRLSPEKDFGTLIRAAALMSPRPGLRIAIGGEGPARDELAALIGSLGIGNRVQLLGRLPEPFGLLRRASLAVCSSRYEGFGNALVEALACGTPVVSTDCPYGPSEILDGGRYGTLVPVGEPGPLAAAMAAALDRPCARDALRRRAALHTLPRAAVAFLRVVDAL
jgi:glycosyltransferase involved in cell wall biosynthesis